MSRLKRTVCKYPKESPNTLRTNVNEFREVAEYKISI